MSQNKLEPSKNTFFRCVSAPDGWRGHATGDWGCPWASRASRFMGDGIVVNDSQSCRLGFCLLHTTGEFVGQPGGARDGSAHRDVVDEALRQIKADTPLTRSNWTPL
jgi:hypothetical protein